MPNPLNNQTTDDVDKELETNLEPQNPVQTTEIPKAAPKQVSPKQQPQRRKLRPWVAPAFIVIVVGVAGYIAYDRFRDRTTSDEGDNQTEFLNPQDQQPQPSFGSPPVGSVPVIPTPRPADGSDAVPTPKPQPRPTTAPAPVTTTNYSNPQLQFSVQVPSNWSIKPSAQEVVIIAPSKARYSVQMYAVSGTTESLGAFLRTLPNLHNVSAATIANHPGFSFAVDGFYGRGYAFVDNNRLYYLLGSGIENSAVAKTFKTL
jgi:hypothetical protein